jgi:hypothetical protein
MKFIPCYLSIGVVQCALEQGASILLHLEGGSLGRGPLRPPGDGDGLGPAERGGGFLLDRLAHGDDSSNAAPSTARDGTSSRSATASPAR